MQFSKQILHPLTGFPHGNFGKFTNPFRYSPHEAVVRASKEVMAAIEASAELSAAFSEGKMLGVLVVGERGAGTGGDSGHDDPVFSGKVGFLAAFSGNAGGKSVLEGFVPPIFDLSAPGGVFKRGESEITAVNLKIKQLLSSEEYRACGDNLTSVRKECDETLAAFRETMAEHRRHRDEIRCRTDADESLLDELVAQSQREKADFKRLKQCCAARIAEAENELRKYDEAIAEFKEARARMSEDLQKWIFSEYIVHNALGEEASIEEIFAAEGLVPPGGTGECAAPKLLEYAYRNGMRPLAMGEFWYGRSPSTAVRNQGCFYPSCTSKCGPLLGYMLKGLEVEKEEEAEWNLAVIYRDDFLLAVDKPSGVPSVPGLDGRKSVQEKLSEAGLEAIPVHRLDMDTSGVLLFALNEDAAASLRQQFQEHSVKKTYIAVLETVGEIPPEGVIELPLSPDYDERPRQKVDRAAGKPSVTHYRVIGRSAGLCRVELHPLTGRTHQLRVHCAHSDGLGSPILGDRLYGSPSAPRLHLHARSIVFRHPVTGEETEISCPDRFC